MAHAIASAIEKNGELRLLPMSSGGGIETLRDLVFLRGVDMAIVPVNALAQAKATESLGPSLPQRIAYIARLYNEEVHLLVGRNTKALADLSGKKIAVPVEDGSALFTARDLFARFSVNAEIVRMPAAEALELVRAGDIGSDTLDGGQAVAAAGRHAKGRKHSAAGAAFHCGRGGWLRAGCLSRRRLSHADTGRAGG